jgi:CBS domain-containing protein
MQVGEIMARGIEFVAADASVRDAAIAMAANDIGAVLVGSEERLEGILTDRDIIIRAVVHGRDVTSLRVGEVMSSDLFTCRPETPVEAALEDMDERQIRRMPVVDAGGRVVGIVARRDLIKPIERGPVAR